MIHRWFAWALSPRIEEEDLVQVGRLGLMRAAQTFDPAKGAFITYATPWVANFLRRYIQSKCRLVHVPRHAELAGRAVPERLQTLDACRTQSLQASNTELADWANRHDVQKLLALIGSERTRRVVEECCLRERTLEEVAVSLGVTRERVRQLREAGLRRCGPPCGGGLDSNCSEFDMATLTEKVNAKFERLLAEGQQTLTTCGWDGKEYGEQRPDSIEYLRFRTECLNLTRVVCGETSDHYRELRRYADNASSSGNPYYYKDCYAILQAANQDYRDGCCLTSAL